MWLLVESGGEWIVAVVVGVIDHFANYLTLFIQTKYISLKMDLRGRPQQFVCCLPPPSRASLTSVIATTTNPIIFANNLFISHISMEEWLWTANISELCYKMVIDLRATTANVDDSCCRSKESAMPFNCINSGDSRKNPQFLANKLVEGLARQM